ncbi:MAG: hypothetical protein K6E53_04305 [Lachnospiraceae bacterium]|nr:hypothetical protein [Lachnospiraceae bacterium]
MAEEMIRELKRAQKNMCERTRIADSVILKSPGQEPVLVKEDAIDRELINFGLFLELYDLDAENGLIMVFDSRKSFEIGSTKYVFGQVMVVHKGRNGTECMTEEEICQAVIDLMDSEVPLNYDGTDFTVYKLG